MEQNESIVSIQNKEEKFGGNKLSDRFYKKMQLINRSRTSYLFLTPFTLVFATFTLVPVLIAIFYGFTQFNILQPPKFIGLDNYRRLFFEDDIFLIAVKNTFVFAIITGPVGYMLSLLIAWFVNELSPKIRALMTLLFYAPALAGGASITIWLLIFSGDQYGLLNSVLMPLNLITMPKSWLNDPVYMQQVLMVVVLWSSLGAGFLAFIAGFQTVSKDLYEAGAVDGIRNRFQELWFITLPAMKGQLMFGAIISITASFQIGDIVNVLFGFPSSNYAAHTIMNHLTDYGMIRYQMGYACAIATLLFLLMVGSNKLVQILISKVGQ
ncbi:MAG: carbohydrate ABC transporter permease [Saccharofermentanales bacterium]